MVQVCGCVVHIVVSRGRSVIVAAMCTALRVNIARSRSIELIRLYWCLLNVTLFHSGSLGSVLPSLWTAISVLIVLLKNVAVMVTVMRRTVPICGGPARTGPVIRSTTTCTDYLGKSVLSAHQKLLLLTNDHTSPADAHPGDQRPGIEAELVHDVKTN